MLHCVHSMNVRQSLVAVVFAVPFPLQAASVSLPAAEDRGSTLLGNPASPRWRAAATPSIGTTKRTHVCHWRALLLVGPEEQRLVGERNVLENPEQPVQLIGEPWFPIHGRAAANRRLDHIVAARLPIENQLARLAR